MTIQWEDKEFPAQFMEEKTHEEATDGAVGLALGEKWEGLIAESA